MFSAGKHKYTNEAPPRQVGAGLPPPLRVQRNPDYASMCPDNYIGAVLSRRDKKIRLIKFSGALTFIELLIAIVIIGILAGIAIPNFKKTSSSFELDNFVKNVYYLTRYLQASAVSTAKIYRLDIVEREPAQFKAFRKEDSDFIEIEGKFGKAYKATGVDIFSVDPQERTSIYFYPDASIDQTTIVFKNQYQKEVSLAIKGANSAIQIK